MLDNVSQIKPIHWFMMIGVLSVLVSRYGTNLVMPPWVEFCLRWGGWALIFLGLMDLLGVFKIMDVIPI